MNSSISHDKIMTPLMTLFREPSFMRRPPDWAPRGLSTVNSGGYVQMIVTVDLCRALTKKKKKETKMSPKINQAPSKRKKKTNPPSFIISEVSPLRHVYSARMNSLRLPTCSPPHFLSQTQTHSSEVPLPSQNTRVRF